MTGPVSRPHVTRRRAVEEADMGPGNDDEAADRTTPDRTSGETRPGGAVGLGHVVANASGLGDREPRTPDGPLLEEASQDSFPASDPPGFMSDPATPAEPALARRSAGSEPELRDPRDVP
jgi:hypothetical protein